MDETTNSINLSSATNDMDPVPRFPNYATIRQQFEQRTDNNVQQPQPFGSMVIYIF